MRMTVADIMAEIHLLRTDVADLKEEIHKYRGFVGGVLWSASALAGLTGFIWGFLTGF